MIPMIAQEYPINAITWKYGLLDKAARLTTGTASKQNKPPKDLAARSSFKKIIEQIKTPGAKSKIKGLKLFSPPIFIINASLAAKIQQKAHKILPAHMFLGKLIIAFCNLFG